MELGISTYESPAGHVNKGALELPKDFDSARHAAKWVKNGAGVQRAQEPEIIASEGVQVVPWAVWQSKTKQICKRILASGVFILMFRPKNIQQAANKIYGNVSRKRMVTEGEGHTIGGERNSDTGMLNNSRLSREGENRVFEGQIQINKITQEDTTISTEAVATVDKEVVLQASKSAKKNS